MDRSMYADELNRRYPIDTREAALASYEDARRDGAADSALIRAKFDKAAAFYGISYPVQEKKAAAVGDSFDLGDGRLDMGKMASSEDVEKAAEAVIDLRNTHTRRIMKQAALKVLSRASSLDSDLDDALLRKVAHIAGVGVGDRAEIEHELEKRAVLNPLGASNAEFWKTVNELKGLSDDEFYKQANLEYICSTMEDIDSYFGNTHRYGKDLSAPEAVVFKSTADDLLKEASDLMLVNSADVTLSKKAVLERADRINGFFKAHFGQQEDLEGEKLLSKVAGCPADTFEALLKVLEG